MRVTARVKVRARARVRVRVRATGVGLCLCKVGELGRVKLAHDEDVALAAVRLG